MSGLLARLSNLAAGALVLMARGYQASLSPLLGRQCRFVPTCSEYFIEAVQTLGPVRGTLKGLWRIARCNPLCQGGYDPCARAGGAGEPTEINRIGTPQRAKTPPTGRTRSM